MVFKASFDKANRTSGAAFRGAGLEQGLRILQRIRTEFGVPVTTDLHESWQAAPVAEVLRSAADFRISLSPDDLLVAAAQTGRAVHVKKGQFVAPWDMLHVVAKLRSAGCATCWFASEATFFGYGRLGERHAGIGSVARVPGPRHFDATHSVQGTGGRGTSTGGQRAMVEPLARARPLSALTDCSSKRTPTPTTLQRWTEHDPDQRIPLAAAPLLAIRQLVANYP